MNPLLRPLEELIAKWTNVTVGENKFGNIRLLTATEADVAHVCAEQLERVLRESGIAELLETGQAMWEQVGGGRFSVVGANWHQALAKVRDLRVKVEHSRDGFIID